ncbi:plasmid stabilization protein [Desulfuribacillus stibiiarsenatis]|uniref:Plasmid stabilization protein n=1 Tax=Desulfuribacillus stibiiarsenatis TaxID=1390249 RepID=A0A1E5L3K7_9FIRM|nr:plasmid stabilization protein [Desulfuribacillus stibiiarsenatis]OEH84687.1 plasmid stabilization protein [Desulfuribacillus stibiiarsenatis]
MKYTVKYQKDCIKYLKKLDKLMQIRIIKAINQLPDGDVKLLKNCKDDYRLRVGIQRIIFNKDDDKKEIYIIKISPRGEVYKRL